MIHSLTRLGLVSKYLPSLNASWKEGIWATIMTAITDYYLIPLGLLIGASTKEIGLLIAIPHLLAAMAQLFTVSLVKVLGSRKRFICMGAYFQGALLLPIAVLSLISFPYKVEVFIVFVALFRITGNLIGTVWGSLVSDYLSPKERGKYIGWRNRITGVAGIAGLVLGGFLLFVIKRTTSPEYAFFFLFVFTACTRLISGYLMGKMENIPIQYHKESDFTFFQFLRRFRESNFVKFVFYVFCFSFATHLSSPFFSVWMLKGLHLNYLQYMSIHLSSLIGSLIAFPLWGRHADHVGNAKVLKMTSFLIPAIPILWILTKNPYLLLLIEFYSGFVWGGFNLCSVNYIYDAVTPQKRVRCLSYFNFIVSLGIFFGAGLGGFLIKILPPIHGYAFYSLFLLSGILRLLCFFFLSGHFREVRASTKHVSNKELFFSVIGIKPLFSQDHDYPVITEIPGKKKER